MRRALFAVVCLGLLASCLGTTGYNLVTFYFAAVGPADAVAGQPYAFTSDKGFRVVLTEASLHVGAVYLDQSRPTSGEGAEPCTLPGTYVGEVRGGGDVDMLSPKPQTFPGLSGDGSTIPAALGQVWLTHGDVNADQDPIPVLSLAGTVEVNGETRSFTAGITIPQSDASTSSPSALPGESPICLERIVTPILVDLTLGQGGTLVLRVDPKVLFTNVDFDDLPQVTSDPPAYGFTNDGSNQPSRNLFENLRGAGGVYHFEWNAAP